MLLIKKKIENIDTNYYINFYFFNYIYYILKKLNKLGKKSSKYEVSLSDKEVWNDYLVYCKKIDEINYALLNVRKKEEEKFKGWIN